ncbi:MAG TPA: hypothetical protein VGG10_07575 [Rhizomicrobium sp.]|jgi:hypothetical protein
MTDQSDREELLRGRIDLQRQIDVIYQPVRARDRNPQLLAKLKGMLAEVEALLADKDKGEG